MRGFNSQVAPLPSINHVYICGHCLADALGGEAYLAFFLPALIPVHVRSLPNLFPGQRGYLNWEVIT